MRLRVGVTVVLILALVGIAAAAYRWPSSAGSPGLGGFSTIAIEPKHGAIVRGPDITIRLQTDNSGAVIRVLLDDTKIGRDGEPSPPDSPQQIEFSDQEMMVEIPVRGLSPGLHSLGIEAGVYGAAHPSINQQRIEFLVEQILRTDSHRAPGGIRRLSGGRRTGLVRARFLRDLQAAA